MGWKASAGNMLGLRYEDDLRTLLWVFLYYSLTALAWIYHPILSGSYVAVTFVSILLAYFSFACASITHNTMHCKVFFKESSNQLLQLCLSLTYGHPVSTFVPGHNLSHHRATQLPEDPMRTSKMRYKWHLLNGLLFQPTVALSVIKGDLRYLQVQRHLGNTFYLNCCREFFLVGLSIVVLLLLDWQRFLVYVHIPHFFAQWGIVSMNMLQHDCCEIVPYSEKNHNVNGSRNFVGPVINFLAFNNGYHSIHHMYPSLHWSRIPEEHNKQVKPKIHPNLEQPCMARYIYRTYVYPGVREYYNGDNSKLPKGQEPPDADWMLAHYPHGTKKEDFEVQLDVQTVLKAVPLLLLKVFCPMYSPVNKVD